MQAFMKSDKSLRDKPGNEANFILQVIKPWGPGYVAITSLLQMSVSWAVNDYVNDSSTVSNSNIAVGEKVPHCVHL